MRDVNNLLMGGEPEYVLGERLACSLLIADDTPRKVLADVQAFVADSAGLGRFAVISPWGSKR